MKALLDQLRPGLSVYVQGGTGEALAFCDALKAEPDRAAGVHFIAGLIPGMNTFDYAALTPTTRLTTFMPIDAIRATLADGRSSLPPMSYSGMAQAFAEAEIDLAVVHVGPGEGDALSFGIATDFGPIVVSHAAKVAAIVNPLMPAMKRGPSISRRECDVVMEAPHALIAAAEAAPSAELQAIAARVAALVPEGAAIQSGVGGAPGAAISALTSHRGLVIKSGMVTEGYRALDAAGALAAEGHVTGLAYGEADFYAYCAARDLCRFTDARETHGVALGEIPRFTSINSALEIDLYGQVNIEWRGTRLISGLGGAPDFVRAARRSPGGRSIIALPATAQGGKTSRIVAKLSSPTVSLSRGDADTIVTEHGVAELIGKAPDARAEALITIAAPEFRDGLADAWRAMRG